MLALTRTLCGLTFLCALAPWAAPVSAAAAAAAISGDETLVEALERYRAAGVKLVYSNALVKARDKVLAVPDPNASIGAQLRALLEPHGLTVEQTTENTDIWYVVAHADAAAPPPEDDAVPPRLMEVEEILVTSPRRRLVQGASTPQDLDASEITGIPSIGRDLLRAVGTLPGQASNGLTVRQRVRGGTEEEVLYLVDGARIIEPFHMKDFLGPFSAFNPNVVDAVDV